jgi:hypothetical protein
MKTKPPKLVINVTEPIIAAAIKPNAAMDPIASAMKVAAEEIGVHIGKINADISTIRFTDLDTKRRYTGFTPRQAQIAMLKIDSGRKPEPFKFKLKSVQFTQ